MMKNRRTFFRHIAAALVVAAAFGSSPARADQGFQNWINNFYSTASKSGLSQATYRKAIAGVKKPGHEDSPDGVIADMVNDNVYNSGRVAVDAVFDGTIRGPRYLAPMQAQIDTEILPGEELAA